MFKVETCLNKLYYDYVNDYQSKYSTFRRIITEVNGR